MKKYAACLFSLLALVACAETSTQQPDTEGQRSYTEQQRAQATKAAALCTFEKASQFARQPSSPSELGMLAALACREDINLAAIIYADGDEEMAARLLPNFMRTMAETAALQIAEQRAL